MYIFVPSWYSSNINSWSQDLIPWYRGNLKMDFDDTISQIRIFNQNNEKVSLLLLQYMPYLRSFLDRFELSNTYYISVFDYLQDINLQYSKSLDYTDFDWPDDVEFIFTFFMLSVYRGEELYATVEYNSEGRLSWIEYYTNDIISEKIIVDDRGFVSSIECYSNGELSYIKYLNQFGIWQFKHYINENKIEINPEYSGRYGNKSFNSIEQLISFALRKINDVISLKPFSLIIAANNKHNNLLLEEFRNCKVAMSLFLNRYNVNSTDFINEAKLVDMLVVDTQNMFNKVKNVLETNNIHSEKLLQVTPYDTRLELGLSQREKMMILYISLDNISDEQRNKLINKTVEISKKNKLIELLFVTGYDNIHQEVSEIINKKNNEQADILDDGINNKIGMTEEIVKSKQHINVKIVKSEEEIITLLKKVRVVIDVSEEPNLFTQIAAISAGIPQINIVNSSYVKHLKNGWIIKDLEEIEESIEFYTRKLSEWNKALIYSIEQINYFTGEQIYSKWKEKLGEYDGK